MDRIFRKFKGTDSLALVELMRQLGYQHSIDSLGANIQLLRKAGGEVFVAEVTGKVCGSVSAIIDIRLAEGMKGEIVSLVVNDAYRGKGLGKGLVVVAEQWLSSYTSEVRVRANVIRVDAHQFYESMGYSTTKKQMLLTKQM